jgi:hypothetical protein
MRRPWHFPRTGIFRALAFSAHWHFPRTGIFPCVMAGFSPATHDFAAFQHRKSRVAGTRPAMTQKGEVRAGGFNLAQMRSTPALTQ